MTRRYTKVEFPIPAIPGYRCIDAARAPRSGELYTVIGEQIPTIRCADNAAAYVRSGAYTHYAIWERIPVEVITFRATGEAREAKPGEWYKSSGGDMYLNTNAYDTTLWKYPIYIREVTEE